MLQVSFRGFRVIVSDLDNWMDKYSPPWASYRALMECRLVTLDKNLGVRPVGIEERLRQIISKIVMR